MIPGSVAECQGPARLPDVVTTRRAAEQSPRAQGAPEALADLADRLATHFLLIKDISKFFIVHKVYKEHT